MILIMCSFQIKKPLFTARVAGGRLSRHRVDSGQFRFIRFPLSCIAAEGQDGRSGGGRWP